jgi:uncharacterized membrane protein (UPF0127 family)
MDNAIRRDILARAKATGYPGSITEAFQAYDQGRDLVGEFMQQQQMPQMQVAETPEEQEQGLGPAHAAGNFDQSMAFPNVQPGQSFNTMRTKVDIDVEKFDKQGNLVESYKAVPPGIANLPTGPYEGTVIESPARMKFGGINKYQTAGPEKKGPAGLTMKEAKALASQVHMPVMMTSDSVEKWRKARENNLDDIKEEDLLGTFVNPEDAKKAKYPAYRYGQRYLDSTYMNGKTVPYFTETPPAQINPDFIPFANYVGSSLGYNQKPSSMVGEETEEERYIRAVNIKNDAIEHSKKHTKEIATHSSFAEDILSSVAKEEGWDPAFVKKVMESKDKSVYESPVLYVGYPEKGKLDYGPKTWIKSKEYSEWQKEGSRPSNDPYPDEVKVKEVKVKKKLGGVKKYQTAGPETPPANLLWIGNKGQVLSEQEQKIKAERELDTKFGLGPRVGKVDKITPVVEEPEEFEVNEDPMLQIRDTRKTRLTTGKAIDPNKDLMTRAYPTTNLKSILSTAKARGLSKEDALTLAAMDLQETQWGITDEQTGHVLNGDTSKPPVENFIDAFIKSRETADRLKIKDEYTRLQVYNGLGMITPDTEKNYHGFRMKKIYGVEVPESGINMRNNPLYGKQIVDLRDNVLRKNPEFLSLVDSYYDEKKTGGSYQTNQEISMYEWRTGRPEESRKRYIVGGLKNRVLYNKAKYKR